MNFQEFADGFDTVTGIISVQKTDDGGYGEIRIVTGNRKYIDMIEHPTFVHQHQGVFNKFIPDSPYERYLPKNLSFEDLCADAAIHKKPIHTYVHLNEPDMWFNVFVMPIDHEQGDLCYCSYSTNPVHTNDLDILTTASIQTSSDVIKTCIKLHATDDFEQTMKEVIHDIRLICGAEVCSLMLVDTAAGTCQMLATNLREGSRIKRVTQFVNFYDIAMSWIDTIGESDCLIIKSEKDMKYISEINNPWYLTLVEAGVDSVVMFPLRYNGEVLGFIWATNFETKNAMRIKETLELTTFFLSSQIASYNLKKRLEMISFTDLLTGVYNRNAMNSRVSEIVSCAAEKKVTYWVVFADLNGLKKMNDVQGHSAGDLLLKKAAILLQELFKGNDIYRAGGDEFVVIIPGCDRQELEKKVDALREASQDPENVCLAVGSSYCGLKTDIRDAMRDADEDMYERKSRYYSRYPERKWR